MSDLSGALSAAGFSTAPPGGSRAGGGGGGNGGGGSGGGGGGEDAAAAKRAAAEEARRSQLSALLTPAARERLARVGMVRPENARAVEDHLLRLAAGRKLTAAVTEDDVISILEEVTRLTAAGGPGGARVKIDRRRQAHDEDEDDNDDDL